MLPKIPFIAQVGAGSVAQQVKVLMISGAHMAQERTSSPKLFSDFRFCTLLPINTLKNKCKKIMRT